ncbi:AzlC family ABC transporter permease [Microlunatus speluncae]|uniref:AzlC family ABC transporter permease n=1 Tax=Microlunatus speluncae TaxID=2594267 RepID=UPI001FE6174B|nr:AzlC family ABC transporter permease [Microlunatus speluncae]
MVRDVAVVCAAVALVAVSYGAIAVGSGFDLWVPALLSVTVLAGSAEFLFVGILAAGGGPVAAVAAGLLVNARHLPFGLSVADTVGIGWRRLLGSHLMNDESVALALGQTDPERRRAVFWLCGLGVLICWPGGAVLGGLLGGLVAAPEQLGLDAMFPAVLLAVAVPALKRPGVRRAAGVGCLIALVGTPFLPPGLPVLVALTGLLTMIIPAVRKARR